MLTPIKFKYFENIPLAARTGPTILNHPPYSDKQVNKNTYRNLITVTKDVNFCYYATYFHHVKNREKL